MKGKFLLALLAGLFATSFITPSNDCGSCGGKGNHSESLLDGSCDRCKKGR